MFAPTVRWPTGTATSLRTQHCSPTRSATGGAPIKGGDSAPDVEQRIAVNGAVTDSPFDRYTSTLELHVVGADGNELPIAIAVLNTDAFFGLSTSQANAPSGGTLINLNMHRSMPTLVFAVFIMVLMLGLAAAAAALAAHDVLYLETRLDLPSVFDDGGHTLRVDPAAQRRPG